MEKSGGGFGLVFFSYDIGEVTLVKYSILMTSMKEFCMKNDNYIKIYSYIYANSPTTTLCTVSGSLQIHKKQIGGLIIDKSPEEAINNFIDNCTLDILDSTYSSGTLIMGKLIPSPSLRNSVNFPAKQRLTSPAISQNEGILYPYKMIRSTDVFHLLTSIVPFHSTVRWNRR
jgi:hypothetical protein